MAPKHHGRLSTADLVDGLVVADAGTERPGADTALHEKGL